MKISGAQWNVENVNQILSERLSLSEWFTSYLSVSAKSGCSLLIKQQDYLKIHNRIYESIFNSSWIEYNL